MGFIIQWVNLCFINSSPLEWPPKHTKSCSDCGSWLEEPGPGKVNLATKSLQIGHESVIYCDSPHVYFEHGAHYPRLLSKHGPLAIRSSSQTRMFLQEAVHDL